MLSFRQRNARFLCYFCQKARDCSRKFVILQMFPRRCFALWWSGWDGDDIMDIGVFWRLGFDGLRISQIQKLFVKNKATRTSLRVFIDSPQCIRMAVYLSASVA